MQVEHSLYLLTVDSVYLINVGLRTTERLKKMQEATRSQSTPQIHFVNSLHFNIFIFLTYQVAFHLKTSDLR